MFCPGWCGSMDWAPACKPKGHWFNSMSGHMPGLRARSPAGSRDRQPHIEGFSPSLPLSLKINKIFFKKERNWKCTRFAHVGRTENAKGSPGKVEKTRVHTLIALIFYFAFFSAPLGAILCINFTPRCLRKLQQSKHKQISSMPSTCQRLTLLCYRASSEKCHIKRINRSLCP